MSGYIYKRNYTACASINIPAAVDFSFNIISADTRKSFNFITSRAPYNYYGESYSIIDTIEFRFDGTKVANLIVIDAKYDILLRLDNFHSAIAVALYNTINVYFVRNTVYIITYISVRICKSSANWEVGVCRRVADGKSPKIVDRRGVR